MKNLLIILIISSLSPFFIGKFQYSNACLVIENITDKTDGEIEDVLYTFDFKLDAFTEPQFKDYYISGIETIGRAL